MTAILKDSNCMTLFTYAKILIANWRTHHKLGPSIYLLFYNILTMCLKFGVNEMLIQSLIWCYDGIVIHSDD
jgi:hypothetical protein